MEEDQRSRTWNIRLQASRILQEREREWRKILKAKIFLRSCYIFFFSLCAFPWYYMCLFPWFCPLVKRYHKYHHQLWYNKKKKTYFWRGFKNYGWKTFRIKIRKISRSWQTLTYFVFSPHQYRVANAHRTTHLKSAPCPLIPLPRPHLTTSPSGSAFHYRDGVKLSARHVEWGNVFQWGVHAGCKWPNPRQRKVDKISNIFLIYLDKSTE